MIKLQKLKVEKFKSLIKTEVEEFGDVNMFFGFNNSGKSNIFKFLKLLFEKKKIGTKVKYDSDDSLKDTVDLIVADTNFWAGYIWSEPFLFFKNIRTEPITFEVELLISNDHFEQEKILKKEKYLGKSETILRLNGTITANSNETSYLQLEEAFLNNKKFYRYEDRIEYFFEGSPGKALEKQTGENLFLSLNDLILYIDTDRNLVKETSKEGREIMDSKNFKNALFQLYINAERNEDFNELVKFLGAFSFSPESIERLGGSIQSFPFTESTEVTFSKFDEEIEVMLKNETGRLPLKNFGTGIQQFLFLLAIIHESKSRIIIIEEIELNLSPLYQKELVKFLKTLMPKAFDQLIFSSHSPFFAKQDFVLMDFIQFVQMDAVGLQGTSVECHDKEYIASGFDEAANESVLSRFFS